VLRRAVSAAARQQPSRLTARRTLLDRPNTIIKQQREIQGEATPYLRGDADPTYLRRPGDSTLASVAMGAVALAWVIALYDHVRMWNGRK